MSRRPILAGVLTAVTALAPGCPTPCTVDEDCPDLHGCVDELCVQECTRSDDCPVGSDCSTRGLCLEQPTGSVSWIEPAADSTVAERFDGAVSVRFRGRDARLRVQRDVRDPGNACAPVPPLEIRIVGDPEETFEQRVELPGLFSGGGSFSLVATLEAAGGFTGDALALRGPAGVGAPLEITRPTEGVLEGDPLLVELSATLVATPQSVAVRVTPEQGAEGARVTLPPTAERLASVWVPVARGRQSVTLEGQTAGGEAFTCGRGVLVAEDGAGLELALWFVSTTSEDALLGLRARIDDGRAVDVCSARDPSAGCDVHREPTGLGARGDEVLVVDRVDGLVEVAVVPAAISAPVLAGVRVSYQGQHVAFLGPFTVDPGQGEVWLAGDIAIAGGVPSVTPRFEVQTGSPF